MFLVDLINLNYLYKIYKKNKMTNTFKMEKRVESIEVDQGIVQEIH